MTETQTHYITPGSYNLKIPSRNDFHHFASDILSEASFVTDHPNGHVIENIAASLRWTLAHKSQTHFVLYAKE